MREPVTQTIEASEVRQRWSDLLDNVDREETRVIVERSGVPVAAIISAGDLERFKHLEAERAERFRVIDEMRAAFKDVPPEQIESEVAEVIAEVRAGAAATSVET